MGGPHRDTKAAGFLWIFTGGADSEGVHALPAHCAHTTSGIYLNNFSRKWFTFEALLNTS